jgi:hypothetical protein
MGEADRVAFLARCRLPCGRHESGHARACRRAGPAPAREPAPDTARSLSAPPFPVGEMRVEEIRLRVRPRAWCAT